jgi:RimJ/RimL family protein N-acetyltransferase
LTNHSAYISRLQQLRWYFRTYSVKQKSGEFRLYLLTDEKNTALAYGALALDQGNLLVTECVAREHRNKGIGTLVLDRLLQIGESESRPLIADILATNAVSIALHEKAGFRFESVFESNGRQLKRYIRRHDTQLNRIFRLA